MKNSLLILCILFVSGIILSCENKRQTLSQPTVDAKAFRNSKEYKEFQAAQKALRDAHFNGEISLRGVNQEKLNELRKDIKNEADYAKALNAAGAKGGEKYAKLVFESSAATRALVFKFPNTKYLSKEELHELLKSEIYDAEVPLPNDYMRNK